MDLKTRAGEAFTVVERELADINQWMYDHPEVGFEEYDTSARLAGFLTDHGFSVEYPAYDLETAFVARAGSDGRTVVSPVSKAR